uniref:Uncharacterized protein n=1 Tax=Anguilla anguilla TaxID=7936 RepID=A0A0E9WK54_ANGAN
MPMLLCTDQNWTYDHGTGSHLRLSNLNLFIKKNELS